jgi:hypothetical protein
MYKWLYLFKCGQQMYAKMGHQIHDAAENNQAFVLHTDSLKHKCHHAGWCKESSNPGAMQMSSR